MARKAPRQYGKLPKEYWRVDHPWGNLSAEAQWLYVLLVSHPTTDTAGIFPVRTSKWAKGAANMTAERSRAAAKELVEQEWIVVDHDTEEGLLRNYIRDDWAGDNIFKGALKRTLLVQSTRLRAVLLSEIRRLDRDLKDDQQELVEELESSIPLGFDFHSPVAATPAPTYTATTQASRRRPDGVGYGVGTASPHNGNQPAECSVPYCDGKPEPAERMCAEHLGTQVP